MWAPSRTPPDSTTVSIAKVNSDYKQLDIAIVKATNHVERPAKEKYIRDIFMHLNSGRARADVAYCIRALATPLQDAQLGGILEPIKAGIRDAKLGVGKQEQDDFFTASANFCIFF
ncbi:putative clathrin assembly protein [Hordeum vulgare]|nr:putative clathrin assembly protein [Hordeum vulgare]